MTASVLISGLASFAAGAGLGALYFAALWLALGRLSDGKSLLVPAILRLSLLGLLIGAALWLGVPAGLVLIGLAGFMAARVIAAGLIMVGSRP